MTELARGGHLTWASSGQDFAHAVVVGVGRRKLNSAPRSGPSAPSAKADVPIPAQVVTLPPVSILRIRPFPESATQRFPSAGPRQ
jgi:hypothetical protein